MTPYLVGRVPGVPPQFAGSFGFVKAPADAVARELVAWHDELRFEPKLRRIEGGLAESAPSVMPLTLIRPLRRLLVGTSSEWTAYFDSGIRGGDPGPPVQVLSERLGVASCTVTAIPFQGESGAVENLLGGIVLNWDDNDRKTGRSVALIEGEGRGSRYHFEALGTVQPWGHPERYSARSKRDRFTFDMLDEYCKALGIDAFNLDFYSGPSYLVESQA